MKMKSEKKEKIAEKTIDLALGSSIIGLPNIFRTKDKSIKLMWILLFTIALGATIYTIIKSINNYFDYEIITNIYVFNQKQAEFPAVTFFILRNSKFNIPLKDIILDCQFNSLSCSSSDFDTIQDNNGHISYSFRNKTSFVPGSYFGFQLVVNLENIPLDNSSKISEFDGLRLTIHNISNDPGIYGGMPLTGFNVAPGFINEISVTRTFINKLGLPYNNCLKDVKSIDSFESDIFKYMIHSTNYSYRQTDCIDYCLGRQIYKFMNITNKIDHWLNINIQSLNVSQAEFINIYLKIYQNGLDCYSECPEECDSIKYETSHTFTKSSSKIDNLVAFNIFYPSLDYTVIDQIPKMDLFDFISNLGGNFGLFIGISFLSFAEFIELFIEIILIFFKRDNSLVQF
jgi:hypothetical protein